MIYFLHGNTTVGRLVPAGPGSQHSVSRSCPRARLRHFLARSVQVLPGHLSHRFPQRPRAPGHACHQQLPAFVGSRCRAALSVLAPTTGGGPNSPVPFYPPALWHAVVQCYGR
ncbi:hypothetical protein DUNSADRAFT_16168 [Dunaliella salina]|uniref:Encoded protein n=1 Tax=Dunaliella salina TaxID=3046 RepID=A0ABQ7G442_DUNSA|nr:hypothetical protein DUNSADRAFT_16168 [Dunaliella salina]|eukprot:KAF5829383.1 hypothetical protein DUNSADRAFT_16168 [Dunaliella salina]